ncbi:DUF6090 family protein [Psychroserpens burtonensis]|uniref:DUF6090 family protein n=1 Tax=Psychroserpens burtonensis TaxID=49278 RepID=UPI000688FCC0|nr:DUF6090 family protein [Psychroserpens burtonensis]
MIKFFRHIRQKQIMENRTGKYLKYAIGEIILVVIGILIALQINTWNENRKAKNEEIKILKALQADFMVSKDRIEGTIKSQSKVMRYSKTLINIHERQDKTEFHYYDTHLDSLTYLIGYGTSWHREELVTGAYNSLTSAGKIDLIQNENLRNLLAQFMADYELGFEDQENSMHLLQELNKETNHLFLKIAGSYFRDKFDYKPISIDSLAISESFFTNDSYFGNLFLKSFDEFNRLKRQEDMRNQIQSILDSIKQELGNE